MSPRQIAPVVGMSEGSVERWLVGGGAPEHRRSPVESMLDPFRPDLERRWEAGCRTAPVLWYAIPKQVFRGSVKIVA